MINHDARPIIVDAPLMLIFKKRQGVFRFLFVQSRRPILRLWLSATYCPWQFPGYMTNNRWHSIDTHVWDGVGSVSLIVFNIRAANISKKDSDIPNINSLQLPVAYLNATINSETRNVEPDIITDGSSQTWPNQRVDEYWSGFGPPRSTWSGSWTGQ